MPRVPYYLGRPARVWIAAMSRRGSARQTRTGSELAGSDIPGQPQPASAAPGSLAGGDDGAGEMSRDNGTSSPAGRQLLS